jgi:integrase
MTIAYEPEKEETQQFSTDTVINQKVKQASSGLQGTIQRLFLRLPTEEDKELLADFILDSLQKQSVKTRTRRVYITALVYLSKYHKYKKSFKQMSDKDIAAFVDGLHQDEKEDPDQSSVATQNTFAGPISKFYRYLYKPELSPAQRRKIRKSEVPGIRLLTFATKTGPRSSVKAKDKWTDQDFAICLKYLGYDPRLACYIAMARDTACRPHELLALKLRDVDQEIKVNPETGQEYARVWIPPYTKKKKLRKPFPMVYSIKNYRLWRQQHPESRNPDAPIFMSREWSAKYKQDASPAISVDSLRQDMKRLQQYFKGLKRRSDIPQADKVKIDKLLGRKWNPYVLRQSAIQIYARAGVDEYHLALQSGWEKGSKMIGTYTAEEDNSEACDDTLMILYKIDVREDKKQQQEIEQELKGRTCSNCGASNLQQTQTCISCQKPLDPIKLGLSIEMAESNQKELEELKAQMTVLQANTNNFFKFLAENGGKGDLSLWSWSTKEGLIKAAKAIEKKNSTAVKKRVELK